MKRIFTLLLIAASAMSLMAQIPNSGFELWSNGPSSTPDGWIGNGSVSQSTDHFSGNYSVRMQSSITPNDTSRGELATGLPSDSNGNPKPVFPVNQRHTSIKGYYKYAPVAGDSAQIGCMLFKSGFTSGFPGAPAGMLGLAFGTTGTAASTFTPFSIDFTYLDPNLVPDSSWIIFSSFVFYRGNNTNLAPLGNSTLYVDAISFDNYATGIDQVNDITTGFKLTPNVNNGQFQLQYQLKESGYATLKIYDMNGREIRNLGSGNFAAGSYSQSYNVSELANGNYLLVLGGENGLHSEKLIIMK